MNKYIYMYVWVCVCVCVNPKLLGVRFFLHQVFLDKPPPEPEAQGTVMGITVLTPQW